MLRTSVLRMFCNKHQQTRVLRTRVLRRFCVYCEPVYCVGLATNANKFVHCEPVYSVGVACIANLAENLIQLVNIIGSIFYGNVLGIFLLAFFFKHVRANAVFIAAFITQFIIISLFALDYYEIINLPFLWLNFVGCFLAIIVAMLLDFKQISKNNKYILAVLITVLCVFGHLILKNSNLI